MNARIITRADRERAMALFRNEFPELAASPKKLAAADQITAKLFAEDPWRDADGIVRQAGQETQSRLIEQSRKSAVRSIIAGRLRATSAT